MSAGLLLLGFELGQECFELTGAECLFDLLDFELGQFIAPFVGGVAGMAFEPVPLDLVS